MEKLRSRFEQAQKEATDVRERLTKDMGDLSRTLTEHMDQEDKRWQKVLAAACVLAGFIGSSNPWVLKFLGVVL